MSVAPLNFYVWDIETFLNCFLFTGKFHGANEYQTFEISTRKNERSQLLQFLSYLQNAGVTMVGFNNLGFDYPVIHTLLNEPYTFTYQVAYLKAQEIIQNQGYGQQPINIRMSDRIIPQLDLVKVNHFDNINKRTPLKSLQFAMRLESVEDMPFRWDIELTSEQIEWGIAYNKHDVKATEQFLVKNMHLIEMRKELLDSGTLSGDVLNYSDVKIGSEILIKKIGRQKCFLSGSRPRQTFREYVSFNEVILPKIHYRTEAFENVLHWFKQQIYYVKGEENPKYEAELAGLDFYFGVGGAHASVDTKFFRSTDTHVIMDLDVTGMYPSIAIANGFAPEHLGKDFSEAYKQLVADRARYKKGTTMNAVLKLASNGAFGNSDNPYSCFYDPRFPKQITINGQLQILQLAELLSLIPGVRLIQVNTDGVTVYMPRAVGVLFQLWKKHWEDETLLKLEEVEYSKMWIRDVNNYLVLTKDGKIKAKGAYWYPKEEKDYDGVWNKDFSSMVVQKVTEQVLINNWNPEALIRVMSNPFDFMIRYKTPAGAKVYIGEKEMLKTVRYYVSVAGEKMKKIAGAKGPIGTYKRKNKLADEFYNQVLSEIPEGSWDERIHTKNKSKYDEVVTSIENGYLVKECNDASKFNWDDVNYEYYLKEIEKLFIGENNVER